MCVRVRVVKYCFDVKWMFKDIVEMKWWDVKWWDVKWYNIWKFGVILLIYVKWNLYENEYLDSWYIFYLVGLLLFFILWKILIEWWCFVIYDGGWMKVDIF